MPGDDNTTARNIAHRREWKGGSLTNDGRIVIPISMIQNKRDLKWVTSSIRGGGGFNFRPSRVQLADFFPLEPGFSVTLHKAQVRRRSLFINLFRICAKFSMGIFQGRTIPKVILSLSEHPDHRVRMTWEHLYVALSRIRKKDDMRLLLRLGDRSSMKYISSLHKNKTIECFFKGYSLSNHKGVKWNPMLAASAAGFSQDKD